MLCKHYYWIRVSTIVKKSTTDNDNKNVHARKINCSLIQRHLSATCVNVIFLVIKYPTLKDQSIQFYDQRFNWIRRSVVNHWPNLPRYILLIIEQRQRVNNGFNLTIYNPIEYLREMSVNARQGFFISLFKKQRIVFL